MSFKTIVSELVFSCRLGSKRILPRDAPIHYGAIPLDV